jgi:hypothetical protein
MDALRGFLEDLKRQRLDRGHTLGLFHLLIGCRLAKKDGTVISAGMSWRAAAILLKKVRWPKEAVRDLGLEPSSLPPRDRASFWFAAISKAAVDSEEAVKAGKALAAHLAVLGYEQVS